MKWPKQVASIIHLRVWRLLTGELQFNSKWFLKVEVSQACSHFGFYISKHREREQELNAQAFFFFFVTTCVASLNVPLTKIIYLHAYILSDCLVMGSASYGVFWSHMACGTNSNVTQWTECAVSFLYKYHKFPEILDLVVAVNLEILMGFTQCRQLKCDKNKDQRFSGHNQIISDHIK